MPVYGGTAMKQQLHALGRKPHVVVGTPGRVMDLLQRRALDFDDVRSRCWTKWTACWTSASATTSARSSARSRNAHQTIFVSATLDDEIKRLARAVHERSGGGERLARRA